jgi:hypothetical protein
VSSRVSVICGETIRYVVIRASSRPELEMGQVPEGQLPVAVRTRFRFKIVGQPLPEEEGDTLAGIVRRALVAASEKGFLCEVEGDSNEYEVGFVYEVALT